MCFPFHLAKNRHISVISFSINCFSLENWIPANFPFFSLFSFGKYCWIPFIPKLSLFDPFICFFVSSLLLHLFSLSRSLSPFSFPSICSQYSSHHYDLTPFPFGGNGMKLGTSMKIENKESLEQCVPNTAKKMIFLCVDKLK